MTAPLPVTEPAHKAPVFRFAARSDTGLVRKNNQDSGYAGAHFLLIADGMGGHAGGDVASAITVARLTHLDEPDCAEDSLEDLGSAVLAANEQIIRAVKEKPELAGMGTTVSALLQSGGRLALAHIGDSRAFVMHKGELKQVTSDHTFVQMLVDEGRISPEEAETHPQRSVVMRVLGDVGTAPELDLSMHDAIPGDRWLLCSDGLTGFAREEDIHEALVTIADPGECCDALVQLALAGGGADNVTVVVGDLLDPSENADIDDFGEAVGSIRINPSYALLGRSGAEESAVDTSQYDVILDSSDETPTAEVPVEDIETQPLDPEQLLGAGGQPPAAADHDPSAAEAGTGAAAGSGAAATGSPDSSAASGAGASAADAEHPADPDQEAPEARTSGRGRARKRAAASGEEPEDPDDDLADWGEDPEPRRRIAPFIVTLAVVLAVLAAAFFGWRYVQSQYYVAELDGSVAVYQGLPQTLGPLELSSLDENTDVSVTDLSTFSQQRLEATIAADSREAAQNVVDTLRAEADRNTQSMEGQSSDEETDDPAPSPTAGGADTSGSEADTQRPVQGEVSDETGAESTLSRTENQDASP